MNLSGFGRWRYNSEDGGDCVLRGGRHRNDIADAVNAEDNPPASSTLSNSYAVVPVTSLDDNIDTFVASFGSTADTPADTIVTKTTPKIPDTTNSATTADVETLTNVDTAADRNDYIDNYNPFAGNIINDLTNSAVEGSIRDWSSSNDTSTGSRDFGSSTGGSSIDTGSKDNSSCGCSGIGTSISNEIDEVSNDIKDAVGKDAYAMGKGALAGWGLSSGGLGCVLMGILDYCSGNNGSLVECVINEFVNSVKSVFEGVGALFDAIGSFFGGIFGSDNSDNSAALDSSMNDYIENSPIETTGLSNEDTNALTDMSWADNIDFGDDSNNSDIGDTGTPDCQVTELGSEGIGDSCDYYGGGLESYDIDPMGLSEADISALTDMSWADSIDFGDYSQPMNWGLTAGGCAGDYGRSEYRGLC